MDYIYPILAFLAGAVIFFFVGNKYRMDQNRAKIGSAKSLADKIIDDANREAETYKKEALLEAKEEIHRMRDEQEAQYVRRQNELQDTERRLNKREDLLDDKSAQMEAQEKKLAEDQDRLKGKETRADQLIAQRQEELERIAELNQAQARELVLEKTREDAVHERAQILREEEAKTRDEAESRAREIITRTVQRYASDFVAESTVTVVPLPNDEMKGTHQVPFSREIWIEREDFMIDPPKKYFRLFPGNEVRLQNAYIVKATDYELNENGEVAVVHATYDPDSFGGNAADGRKIRGTIHWVPVRHGVTAEVRLYEPLFSVENPDAEEADYRDLINPNSLTVISNAVVEPWLTEEHPDDTRYQFMRKGYFCEDRHYSTPEKRIFNRIVTLRDSFKPQA